jgi:hypothetical protein
MDATTPDHVVRQKFRYAIAIVAGEPIGVGALAWLLYTYHSVWNPLVVIIVGLLMFSAAGTFLGSVCYLVYYSSLRAFVKVKRRLADDIKAVGG